MTTAPYAFLNEVAPLCSLYSLVIAVVIVWRARYFDDVSRFCSRARSNLLEENFSRCGHFAKISVLLFSCLFTSACIMHSFSSMQRFQRFLPGEYEDARFKIDHDIA